MVMGPSPGHTIGGCMFMITLPPKGLVNKAAKLFSVGVKIPRVIVMTNKIIKNRFTALIIALGLVFQ